MAIGDSQSQIPKVWSYMFTYSFVIRYNTRQHDIFDMIPYNSIQHDKIRSDTVHTIKYEAIRYDTIKYDTIRYNTVQYDTIRYIRKNTTLPPATDRDDEPTANDEAPPPGSVHRHSQQRGYWVQCPAGAGLHSTISGYSSASRWSVVWCSMLMNAE